jgi:hypothetical protein
MKGQKEKKFIKQKQQQQQKIMTYLSPKFPNPFISSKKATLTAPRFADLSSPTDEETVVGGGTNS